MALQIGLHLLQTMEPGTVIAMIDDMPTIVTPLQADIHGLPVVYTFEEARILLTEIALWGNKQCGNDIHETIDLINKRILSVRHHHDRHETIWTSDRKWEQQCQQWEQQHRAAIARLTPENVSAPHGEDMTFG